MPDPVPEYGSRGPGRLPQRRHRNGFQNHGVGADHRSPPNPNIPQDLGSAPMKTSSSITGTPTIPDRPPIVTHGLIITFRPIRAHSWITTAISPCPVPSLRQSHTFSAQSIDKSRVSTYGGSMAQEGCSSRPTGERPCRGTARSRRIPLQLLIQGQHRGSASLLAMPISPCRHILSDFP